MTLTDLATNDARTGTTKEAGNYSFVDLGVAPLVETSTNAIFIRTKMEF